MYPEDAKKTFVLKGIGASPGIVTGKAYLYDRLDSLISFYTLSDMALVESEIKRFQNAVAKSEKELLEVKDKLSNIGGIEPSYIMDVHIMILNDGAFINSTIQFIKDMYVNAEWAIRMTVDKYRDIFDKVEDDYLRKRFNDIQYIAQMILRNLSGKKRRSVEELELGKGVIIIAQDLSPADTAQMKFDQVLGFATDVGGKTSHTAIVARSIEIPAVVGLKTLTRMVHTNDEMIVDGTSGVVIINPDPDILRRYEEKRRLEREGKTEYLKYAQLPAVTLDNYRVEIGGNIEFCEEIPTALTNGAEGIGLFRTEYIYINREELPSEEDHLASYRRVVGVEGLAWSTIRTFDLGGDKFFSDSKLSKEMNPQMGLRAIRFCLREVDLFKVQLRAILRTSFFGKTKLLFPMISGIEEIREAKRILNEVKKELEGAKIPIDDDIEIGIMIEVPSAVIVADELAKEADFFSIGTNDLIQYALAIDRINDRVNYLYEPLHPAVLRLIKQVVDVGHSAGIPVAMCGEMAGDPVCTMILLGLELDELSMHPLAIPKVKKIIRGSTLKESKELLTKVMSLRSSVEIRAYVEAFMKERFPHDIPEIDQ
ncbi:MAG: phosphoenolpyruvate--protein phosphotransferase [Deltaproteobacteria bacterium]|nr:phosphoenolpyruvate--protein phosphotransferase [Deltaproteobacteria bacterium]